MGNTNKYNLRGVSEEIELSEGGIIIKNIENKTVSFKNKDGVSVSIDSKRYYAEMYETNDGGTAISLNSIPLLKGWITSSAGIISSGITFVPITLPSSNDDANKLIIGEGGAGVYRVNLSGFGALSSQYRSLYVSVFKNGVEQQKTKALIRVSNTNEHPNFNSCSLISLQENDYLDIRIYITGASVNFTIYQMNLTIERIG